jgi:hypothetical protein
MKRRIVDGVVLICIVVGAFMAWRTDRQRARLQAEYHRLVRLTGDLDIKDPSKVYLQAVETGEPLHFAWRVYLPQGRTWNVEMKGLGSVSTTGIVGGESIARVRLLENKDGGLSIFEHFGNATSQSTLGDTSLVEFLKGRWGKVKVEQMGSDGAVATDPNELAVILRVTLPDDLRAEAKAKLAPWLMDQVSSSLFELRLKLNPPPK